MSVSEFAARCVATVLFTAARLLGAWPLRLQWRLADTLAWLVYRVNARSGRIARRNLELIAPQLAAAERERRVRAILRAAARTLIESLRVWTRTRANTLALVRTVQGLEHLETAERSGRGVILIAPHFGNIEVVVAFMAARRAFSLVYRQPLKRAGDLFLRRARGGAGITLVPAESTAMRPLWRALSQGNTVGITPDQQPKLGAGEFAPFFGHEALTLSLIPRLAERSGAALVVVWAQRRTDAGFDLHVEPGDPAIAGSDLRRALTAMNAQVEAIARRDPDQYQWTYKRFSRRPPGSGEHNPYFPDCY